MKKREKTTDTKTKKTANLTVKQLEAAVGGGGEGRSYVTGYY